MRRPSGCDRVFAQHPPRSPAGGLQVRGASEAAFAFGLDMCYTHVEVAAAIIHDLPPDELLFHWKGGRVCLDFVATVGERWRRSFERLRGREDLARWLVE